MAGLSKERFCGCIKKQSDAPSLFDQDMASKEAEIVVDLKCILRICGDVLVLAAAATSPQISPDQFDPFRPFQGERKVTPT